MNVLARCWRLFGAATAAVALATTVAPAAAADDPPSPALPYARAPLMHSVRLSPSGQRVAMLITADNGRRTLVVSDLPIQGQARTVAAFKDANVTSVHWVNDKRLVFDAFVPGPVIDEGGAGVFAVDHDGSDLQQLVSWRYNTDNHTGTRITSRLLPYGWFFDHALDDGSADIVMRQEQTSVTDEVTGYRLARVNTQSRTLRSLGAGMPPGARSWVLDKTGEPRVVREFNKDRDRLLVRDGETSNWVVLEDVPLYSQQGLQPLYLEADGQLVVSGYQGGDTLAYYSYDLKARKIDPQPLVRLSRYDVGDNIETDPATRRVVGVHVQTAQPQSVWFDARMAGIQKAVDTALPAGRFNRLGCNRCETTQHVVVHSSSDREPGIYLLYDHAKRSLVEIGRTRPWIDEATQGTRTMHWVEARDGLSFPVVVTHPRGAQPTTPLPAVVLVHGGPYVVGSDRSWDGEAQFLASRGWRVIEPNFRGSQGLGWKLFRAGFKEWGQAMQDDLHDAVQWAAAQKLVDAQRVCIVGTSYGGYAALMGPVRHPGTYRCAASFAGVTDIDLMFTSNRSDVTTHAVRYALPELVGNPKTDAERLRRASPVARVAEIKVPVLLAQGSLDRRVPREHANDFESAARKAGVPVQRVDYHDEGHGWFFVKNHADFLDRLDRFLATSLRTPP